MASRVQRVAAQLHAFPSSTPAPPPTSTSGPSPSPASPPASAPTPAEIEAFRAKYSVARPDAFQLQGISHLALVSSDMERTVQFYGDVLGIPLVKTIALDDGGQHFFFDVGNGNLLAYFWFPNAPKRAPGVASVDPEALARGEFPTAHGSMNHVAFNVPADKLKEYRARLVKAGVLCTPVLYHSDGPEQFTRKLDTNTSFASVYFFGCDGEYLEITAQMKTFAPTTDILHLPRKGEEDA